MSRTTDTLIKTGAQALQKIDRGTVVGGSVKAPEGEWFLGDEVKRGSGSREGSEGENAIC